MAKETLAEKRVKFAVEEVILSFIGALVITFGIMVISAALNTLTGVTDWATVVLGIFVIWLGLLLFTVPIVRKIEQLM